MIHVGIAFDQNYFNQFGALVSSIFNSKDKKDIISFHVITPDLSEKNKTLLQKYVLNNDCQINFYSIDFSLTNQFITKGEWTSAVYYRIFFPLILKNKCERLLYLDSDIVVVNSLTPLFNTNLKDYPIAAVYDNYVKTQPLLGITNNGEYFNSGVLLIDLKIWNEQNISEKTFKFLEQNPEKIKFVDQCALNAVLKQNWLKINLINNLMYSYLPWKLAAKDKTSYLSDKVIIHYTLQRPWNMLCRNPLRDLYYNSLTQFPIKIKSKKYTDFTLKNIFPWLKIRLFELYINTPILEKIYTKMKVLK